MTTVCDVTTMSGIDKLREKTRSDWPNLRKAFERSLETRRNLQDLLSANKFDCEDTSIVAFGSLARNEWTTGSDLDWTLLIDGQADPQHLNVAQRIDATLFEAKFTPPSPGGTFGSMAFSHEIIHQIGGPQDTNRNLTQRILLLLESTVIAQRTDAYGRIIAGILNRYLGEDKSLIAADGKTYRVPRFLLNDIVRFWRTMAVDFASKQRERAGKGWALRNTKLRLSRKLIFVSGLLTCFGCNGIAVAEDSSITPVIERLGHDVALSPLEILAKSLIVYDASNATCVGLFSAYDAFLGILDDKEKRDRLNALDAAQARKDAIFEEVRSLSHAFQDALISLFFKENEGLAQLTITYGVF